MNSTAPIRLMTVLKLVMLACIVVTFFLLLITQNINIKRISEELAARERQLIELNREIQIHRANLSSLKTPEFLQRQVREMGLALREVGPAQIVRAYEEAVGGSEQQVANAGGAR